jgi:ATP-binding cassette subfamily B protein
MADENNSPKKAEDEISGKAYDGRLMMRLARYLKPYKWQSAISVVAVILKALRMWWGRIL